MEQLRGVGHAVGEYVGGGRGDIEEEMEDINEDDAVDEERCDLVDGSIQVVEDEEEEDSIENAHPLLFFFDTETTGLNIYQDHIVELAAKVVGVPSTRITQPSFSSLVHTPRNIPSKGTCLHTGLLIIAVWCQSAYFVTSLVTQKTGISTTMLRHQQPLSAVFSKFLEWVSKTTQEVSEQSSASLYPGVFSLLQHVYFVVTIMLLSTVIVAHNGFAYDFPLLLAEIERRPKDLSTRDLVTHNIYFADTLPHLRQVYIYTCM